MVYKVFSVQLIRDPSPSERSGIRALVRLCIRAHRELAARQAQAEALAWRDLLRTAHDLAVLALRQRKAPGEDGQRGERVEPGSQLREPCRSPPAIGQHPAAKRAVTRFETQRTHGERALLEVRLETGRQHQIRAHMAWLGHPVIGDPRYGTDGARMGLHALRLSITRPKTGKRLTFETPAPDDFLALITKTEAPSSV